MKRLRVEFRAVHYYRSLGGLEACPHTHNYTVEVGCIRGCEEVREVLERIREELNDTLLNDWGGLIYPEPTTENLTISIYNLLPPVEWVSVTEDSLVSSRYDGRDVWVALFTSERGRTSVVAVRGRMDRKGFAANLSVLRLGTAWTG